MRKAGLSVTTKTAAMAMAKVLDQAKGLNKRPSWSTRVKIGKNETAMTRSEKNTAGPTSLSALMQTWR